MKKYLMTATAAMALAIFATSCSNETNFFDPEAAHQKLNQTYSKSFEDIIGTPNPNQTWGFGQPASARMTRAIQPTFNFPSDADASKFLEDVPEGVELLTSGIGRANHYIDETYEGDLNVWGMGTAAGNWQDKSGGILYVKGNCDFSNRSFYFGGNSELYLVKGATLTLGENNGSKNLQSNTMIYIAEGAKLIANGELMLNNGLHIYNHGTIETPKLSTNSNSVLYNVGTVTVETRISVENTESVIVNDGEITATDLNTAGSGKFENNGSVTISGTTFVNSNSNTWVNNGQYHTGSFIYYAASDEVINNCKLTVDELFGINLADNPGNGNFKMDAGASVVTKNFCGGGNWSGTYAGTWCYAQGGPFYIYMGAGSVFKVTETATMNASKADYGIYGPTDGSSYDGVSYAVFEAKNIVMGKANQGFEVTYGGNLAVVAENHFAQGNDGREDHPFADIKGNATIYAPEFNEGLPAINIAESECNPGFGGGGKTIKEQGRIFCEDLGTIGDFDFNDVVFDAKIYTDGTTEIDLLAAGGTLELSVAGKEVHQLFGVQVGTKEGMVNTGITKKDPVPFTADQKYESLIDIPIMVRKTDAAGNVTYYELTSEMGKAPQKICVPIGTKWCDEYVSIKRAYPNFVKWVEGEDPFDWSWIKKVVARLIDLNLSNNYVDEEEESAD